jgi:hypothetical protein
MNVMFGCSNSLTYNTPSDLTTREFFVFTAIPALMYWLGISW